jgi:hypothetical protein
LLTDIFADRYENRVLRTEFGERERRFFGQMANLIVGHLYPFWVDGSRSQRAEEALKDVHDKLAMEFGVEELIPKYYSTGVQVRTRTFDEIYREYLTATPDAANADDFLKQRLSLVELIFRRKGEDLKNEASLSAREGTKNLNALLGALELPSYEERHGQATALFEGQVHELNTRFRQARLPLNFHNGFIQISEDGVILEAIEQPFWALTSAAKWANVDMDMKNAVDLRDSGGRDPALYAAKALESAVKIISNEMGWSRGTEKGAAAYIDNLVSIANGRFIEPWEADGLKLIFSKVRNPLGHGPGADPMPALSPQQTDWVIQCCMSWIRSLIART